MSKKKIDTPEQIAEEAEFNARTPSTPEHSPEDLAFLGAEDVSEDDIAAAVDRAEARDSGQSLLEGPRFGPADGAPAPWNGSRRALDRLSERPNVVGSTPAERAAWSKVDAAFEALADARMAVELLVADQGDEIKAHDKAVADALRAGKSVPKLTPTDWASEARTRRARALIAGEDLVAARGAYDKVAVSEAPKRLTIAVQALHDAKAKADKVCPEAIAAFEAWRRAVAKVEAVAGVADPEIARWTGSRGVDKATLGLIRRIESAAGDMRTALGSEHPVVSGEYAAGGHREMVPPLFARVRIDLEGNEADAVGLAIIEADEGFTKTALLRSLAQHHGLTGPAGRVG